LRVNALLSDSSSDYLGILRAKIKNQNSLWHIQTKFEVKKEIDKDL
jgi:hypothetical protein